MKSQNIANLTHAAVIAALYIVLTLLSNAFGLASQAIQLRLSEALTILPYFTPAAIPGLFVGCLLGNLLTGSAPWDVVCGALATLLGAAGTRIVGQMIVQKKTAPRQSAAQRQSAAAGNPMSPLLPVLLTLPPILTNTLIIPFVLAYVYRLEGSVPLFMMSVGLGEILSCGVLGMLLFGLLRKYKAVLF